jgi:hypothetical protein
MTKDGTPASLPLRGLDEEGEEPQAIKTRMEADTIKIPKSFFIQNTPQNYRLIISNEFLYKPFFKIHTD